MGKGLWAFTLFTASVTTFAIWVVYRVLISEDIPPHILITSPGRTVLYINIVSHIVCFLIAALLSRASDALRWTLASREENGSKEEGVEIATFLALGQAQSVPDLGALLLLHGLGPHLLWCFQRYIRLMRLLGETELICDGRLSFLGLLWLLGLILLSKWAMELSYF
jgi:hypothetical protein